jgi:hypothetical protein
MHTVMAFGQAEHGALQGQEAEAPRRLTTTLYDLMAVIQAVVGPDDTQVVRTVVHLLQSGQLTFLGQGCTRTLAHESGHSDGLTPERELLFSSGCFGASVSVISRE